MKRGTINAELFLFPGKYNIYNSKAHFVKQRKECWKNQVTPFIIIAQWKPQQSLRIFYELKFILMYSRKKETIFKGETPTPKQ